MIELIQFPWSTFCIVQRRILEFSGVKFKITNISSSDRSLVWRLTRERYYGVPVIRDGKNVIFEVSEDSQVIAKYLDAKLQLGLFPWDQEGVQYLLWKNIEDVVEGPCFKLNDGYWKEMVPKQDQLSFLRYKERKFGKGCLTRWRRDKKELLEQLEDVLMPYEEMLLLKPFLLGERPLFVDFDLYGMLGNLMYTGHFKLPTPHTQLRRWYKRMTHIHISSVREKKLHP